MSSWKPLKYRLIGVAPLIMHNGQLSSPLNWFAKEIKKISSKKKKVDSDYERMAELEFKGGMYIGADKRPILPSEGIEAITRAGARKSKSGKIAEANVLCTSHAVLEYDGPKTVDELWEDKRFVLTTGVKNPGSGSRIDRTRPIFHNWACNIEVSVNMSECNEDQVFGWLDVAGEQCGAFDWRPKYGRFKVEKVKEQSMRKAG